MPPTLTTPAGAGSGEPYLFSAGDGLWMTWIEAAGEGHRVLASRHSEGTWKTPTIVAEGRDFFVNWADFPEVHVRGDTVVAHWLQRGSQGGYDYGVRISWSVDGGETWSDPWTPHEDGTPTEHGFVSFVSTESGLAAVWLDGRNMIGGDGHGGEGAMTLRTRTLPIGRDAGPEIVLDARTCECCQTDAVVAGGVPVVAYRDRGEGEVRNIHVARLVDGTWSEGRPVHDDGWVIGGCPVNGPALAAEGEQVAVAWFTAPEDEPRVNVAFSADRGERFGDPVRVDLGAPAGRVDLVGLDGGDVLVTWLERGGDGARILSRRLTPDGHMGDVVTLAETSEARASGFPRMARFGSDAVALAWTEASGDGQVHVSAHLLSEWGSPR